MASFKENPSDVIALQKATLKKVVKTSESPTSLSSPNSPKTMPKNLNQDSTDVLANKKAALKKVGLKKSETSTLSNPNLLKPMPKNQQADFANAKNRLKKVRIYKRYKMELYNQLY